MTPAISVIIPTFNRLKSLRRAIESALAQTLAPFEILICEDGRTASIEQIVASFDLPQVKWLPGPHVRRPALPRNRGISAAQGEWLAFLDDDDVWFPDKLERQLALALDTGCRAVCANAWKLQNGKRQNLCFCQPLPGKFNFRQLLRSNMVVCSSAIIHSSLLMKVKGFPETETLIAAEDYALWLRVTILTDFAYSPEPLLEYTDEPLQSIRKHGVTAQQQKHYVLQDFLGWARSARIPQYFIWQAQAAPFIQSICDQWLRARNLVSSVFKKYII